jgi:heat shock protein HslJ
MFTGAMIFVLLTNQSAKDFVLNPNVIRHETNQLYGTKWYLRKINKIYGNDLPAFKTEEVKGKTAFINFNKEKQSAGGNGGCNSFGSNFSVKGHHISITEIISTQMYCESAQQIENDFFNALSKVNNFEIKGKKLLLYEDKTPLLELEKDSE